MVRIVCEPIVADLDHTAVAAGLPAVTCRPKGSHQANPGNARTRKAVKNPGGTATIADYPNNKLEQA